MPRYRLEHGALTALVVPPPTLSVIKVIRHVLKHDEAEEEPGRLCDVCEALTHGQTQELLDQLTNTKEVPVHPPNSAPVALAPAKRALVRAGYDFDKIVRQ